MKALSPKNSKRMQFCLTVLLVGAVGLSWTVLNVGWADDPGRTASPAESRPGEEGILLLRTGRMVEGRIVKNGADFVVQRANGEMFLPGSSVRMHCKDLKDAYYRLREELPEENSADQHVALGRWCLKQQMIGEARQEFKDALKMDPTRNDARLLLVRVDEVLDPKKVEEKKTEKADRSVLNKGAASRMPPTDWRTQNHMEDAESLGGLSRDAAQQFVRKIQPILMNNCLAAGCHGPDTKNDLRLLRTSSTGEANRHLAEKNLASVLQYVDRKKPRESRLLKAPMENHGKRGRPVFSATHGKDQADELKKWVLSLQEAQPRKDKVQTAAAVKTEVNWPKAEVVKRTTEVAVPSTAKFTEPRKNTPTKSPPPVEAEEDDSEQPVADEPDPFDPAEFNRRPKKTGA